MDILIRGMEMPKENDYTIAIVYGDGVVTEYHEDYWIRGADGEKQFGIAIPVPPHGDLIDRDALLINVDPEIHEDYVDSSGYCWESEWGYTREQIEAVPTVITASE